MITEESPPGTIITFYSYKGGTGRSMAVVNAAYWLGRKVSTSSRKTLVMDWDLEAPGLHRFFAPQADRPENVARSGIINYFDTLHKRLKQNQGLYAELISEGGWKTLDRELPLDDYIIPDVLAGVDFIKAGEFNATYAELVSAFNWIEFYSQFGDVIETFRNLIVSKYAYCLIDSRTGFTDISGICTMLMPEKLVTVFTPNRQSLSGVIDLVMRAAAYRRASGDFRPLSVFPLPSRIENAELSLKKDWREQYQAEFEGIFRNIYQLEKCELSDYFDEVQLPHIAYYAYGESIALLEERSDALSLSRAYENFFQRLFELDFPWDVQAEFRDVPEKVPTAIAPAPDVRLSRHTGATLISYAGEDIFLSYAIEDNVTYGDDNKGWVDAFLERLTARLSELLGEHPEIWRDTKLSSASAFSDVLIIRLSRPTFLVTILSPTYVKSQWYLKELEEFCESLTLRGGINIANKSPIFKVVKSPIEYYDLPPHLREILQSLLGYEFYEIDRQSGRAYEFRPDLGQDYLLKFLQRIEDLAIDIKEFIKFKKLTSSSHDNITVFLAETTPDLAEERDRIKRELQLHSYRVLPDESLPFDDDTFAVSVLKHLSQSAVSIHLIGSDYVTRPSDGNAAELIDLQYKMAAARVRAQHELAMSRGDGDPGFYRVIWMPEGLKAQEATYRIFIDYLQNDPGVYDGGEVLLGVNFEDVLTIIRKKLDPLQLKSAGDDRPKRIYLICDKPDVDAAAPLQAYLEEQGYEVILPFERDGAEVVRSHRQKLRLCDAVIIFYGSADTIEYKLADLRRSEVLRESNRPLLAKGVYVGGQETGRKRAFHTDDAMVMKDFGEFSPESIKPFLEQVEKAHKERPIQGA